MQHITMGRINDHWDKEFTPLFAEVVERQVATTVQEHNAKHGLSLALRAPKPEPCWLDKETEETGTVLGKPAPGAIPVWVWWAE